MIDIEVGVGDWVFVLSVARLGRGLLAGGGLFG